MSTGVVPASIAARRSRYVAPPAPPPPASSWLREFVLPAIPMVPGLAVIALVFGFRSPAPAAMNAVALDPAAQITTIGRRAFDAEWQTMTAGIQTVNGALKGSRLETAAPAVAAAEVAPKRVRVVSITPDLPLGALDPELKSPVLKGKAIYGLASYYSRGQKTANGERFKPSEMTAAHRTLPFGTRVRVTRLDTGSSVTVRINDRGPYIRGRNVDLSRAAADKLGMRDRGVAKVKIDVLQ